MTFSQGTKHTVCNSIVAMGTDLWCHLTLNSRGAWHTYSVCHGPLELKSEMLPEIHTMEKFYFPKHIIFLK